MEAAKNRVEQLLRQLSAARTDFTSTKQAAYKASSAAHEAKVNAARNKRMSNTNADAAMRTGTRRRRRRIRRRPRGRMDRPIKRRRRYITHVKDPSDNVAFVNDHEDDWAL